MYEIASNLRNSCLCHARVEQRRARLFPLPVGLSRRAFSPLLNAWIIWLGKLSEQPYNMRVNKKWWSQTCMSPWARVPMLESCS